eukprot:scaffold96095_cov20-Tisochrysis_lutea.AAC.1
MEGCQCHGRLSAVDGRGSPNVAFLKGHVVEPCFEVAHKLGHSFVAFDPQSSQNASPNNQCLKQHSHSRQCPPAAGFAHPPALCTQNGSLVTEAQDLQSEWLVVMARRRKPGVTWVPVSLPLRRKACPDN